MYLKTLIIAPFENTGLIITIIFNKSLLHASDW
jgi:hypothetical protein